nr:MAG TPA: hypothetical protein [Caudoviricetes sp.]
MKLELVTPTAMKQLCDKPVNIDRTVDKDAIKEIVDHFMLGGLFLMEVKIDDDERMILRNTQALKDYIEANDIHAGVHQRQERIFLRNDTVPIAFAAAYPRAIVNASKRNRLKFETEKKV